MNNLYRLRYLVLFLSFCTVYSCSYYDEIDEKSSDQEVVFKNSSNSDIHIFYELYYIQLGEVNYSIQEDFDPSNKLTPGKTRSNQFKITWSEDKYEKVHYYNFWAGRDGEVLSSIVDYKFNHKKNNKYTVTWNGSKLIID